MAETSFPNSCAEDLKKRVMEIFEDITKDREDEKLNSLFWTIGKSYDSLNDFAIQWFGLMSDMGNTDKAKEMFKPLSDLGILSHVAVFTMVISLYCGSRKAESALKVYHHMIATGMPRYFLESLDKGMKLNPTPFWNLMKAIAYQEALAKFKEFLEQIKAKGFILHDNGFFYKQAYLTEAREVLKMFGE
ncbi:hypothetical protein ACLB2K_046773 [Fragaria x ananassa]